MIHVGVLKDRNNAKEFIEKNALPESEVILYAEEEDGLVGFAALHMEGFPPEAAVRVTAVDYLEEDMLEMLLRAAFSYGERRSAGTVLINFEQPEKLLASLGFRQIDGELKSRVENVVHMCRNCAEGTD